MKNTFYEWMIILRHDRLKKMLEFQNNGIEILDKRTFLYTTHFHINNSNKSIKFEVRLSSNEYYFYIHSSDKNKFMNHYFTMIDIYRILSKLKTHTRKSVLKIISDGLIITEKIEYDGQEFEVKLLNYLTINKNKKISYEGGEINLRSFLILLSIIQEKSNVLFRKKKEYQNGLLNMLFVLLVAKQNHPTLINKGWHYNRKTKFNLLNKKIVALFYIASKNDEFTKKGYLDNIKSFSIQDELVKFYVSEYNKYNDSKITIEPNNLLSDDSQYSEFEDILKSNPNLRDLIIKSKSKGLLELDDSEDFKNCHLLRKIRESYYSVLIINTFSDSKYYLTAEEKEDIIRVGI